jgi:hypothetical protein
MKRPHLVALLSTFVLSQSGCKGASGAAIGEAAAAVAVDVAATAIAEAARASGDRGGAAPSGDPSAFGPRPIDAEHARAVLLETNVDACWPAGLPHAAGDVQVTFARDGTVQRVGVARPNSGPLLDAACVAAKLREVIIDPFDGDPVVVVVTYGDS